jgi:hypothetical protein
MLDFVMGIFVGAVIVTVGFMAYDWLTWRQYGR